MMKKVYTLILVLVLGVFFAGAELKADEVNYEWIDFASGNIKYIGQSNHRIADGCIWESAGINWFYLIEIPENAVQIDYIMDVGDYRQCQVKNFNSISSYDANGGYFLSTSLPGIDFKVNINENTSHVILSSAASVNLIQLLNYRLLIEVAPPPPPPPPPSFADVVNAGADVIISFFMMIGLVFGAIFDILLTPIILLPLSVIIIALSFAYARRIIAVIRRIFGG